MNKYIEDNKSQEGKYFQGNKTLYYSYDTYCNNYDVCDENQDCICDNDYDNMCDDICNDMNDIQYDKSQCNCKSFIQAQITCNKNKILKSGEILKFDSIINTNNHYIQISHNCEEFIISKKGCYFINWMISLGGSLDCDGVSFAICTCDNMVISSTVASCSSQITGQAIIDVTHVPYTIRLVNTTDTFVQLANIDIQGDILVVGL